MESIVNVTELVTAGDAAYGCVSPLPRRKTGKLAELSMIFKMPLLPNTDFLLKAAPS